MRKSVLLLVALALVATGCGQAGGDAVEGTIEVTGSEYAFEGVPALVAPGAELTFSVPADAEEVHEMVVIRIPASETRTLEELLELPEEETADFPFQGVLIAVPGEDGVSPEDQSTSITVTDPGRYAVLCFLPQGLDQETFEAATADAGDAAAEGPPPFPEGTPHAFLGMVAELTVEG